MFSSNHGKPDFKKPPKPKKKKSFLKRTAIKKKFPKATGELPLFKKIFQDRGRRCQITGSIIFEFDVSCMMHVLSKGTRTDLRLNPDNILCVLPDVHFMYDNFSKEKVLQKYPQMSFVYALKEKLKSIPIEKI